MSDTPRPHYSDEQIVTVLNGGDVPEVDAKLASRWRLEWGRFLRAREQDPNAAPTTRSARAMLAGQEAKARADAALAKRSGELVRVVANAPDVRTRGGEPLDAETLGLIQALRDDLVSAARLPDAIAGIASAYMVELVRRLPEMTNEELHMGLDRLLIRLTRLQHGFGDGSGPQSASGASAAGPFAALLQHVGVTVNVNAGP